jgi:hypothetical protein
MSTPIGYVPDASIIELAWAAHAYHTGAGPRPPAKAWSAVRAYIHRWTSTPEPQADLPAKKEHRVRQLEARRLVSYVRRKLVPPVTVKPLSNLVLEEFFADQRAMSGVPLVWYTGELMVFVGAGARPFKVMVGLCGVRHSSNRSIIYDLLKVRAEFLGDNGGTPQTWVWSPYGTNWPAMLQDPEWAPLAPYVCTAAFGIPANRLPKEKWKAALKSHAPIAAAVALFNAVKECAGVAQLRAALAAAAPLGLRAQPMVAWWRRSRPWHVVSYAAAKGTLPALWTLLAWGAKPDQLLRAVVYGDIEITDEALFVAFLAGAQALRATFCDWIPWPAICGNNDAHMRAMWTPARAAWGFGGAAVQ